MAKKKKKVSAKKVVNKKKTVLKKVVKTKKIKVKKPALSYYQRKKKERLLAEKATTYPSAFIAPLNPRVVKASEINVPVHVTPVAETPKSKRPVKYLNNRDLLAQVILSKKSAKMSNELAKMLQLLTSRYAKKGNFASYTYNEDMQGYAMLMLVKTWNSFDPAKSSNPFAFFTQCIKNSFIQFLNSEKRQRDIKDEVLVDGGMMPSYSYQLEHSNSDNSGDVHEPDMETQEVATKPTLDVNPFDPIIDETLIDGELVPTLPEG